MRTQTRLSYAILAQADSRSRSAFCSLPCIRGQVPRSEILRPETVRDCPTQCTVASATLFYIVLLARRGTGSENANYIVDPITIMADSRHFGNGWDKSPYENAKRLKTAIKDSELASRIMLEKQRLEQELSTAGQINRRDYVVNGGNMNNGTVADWLAQEVLIMLQAAAHAGVQMPPKWRALSEIARKWLSAEISLGTAVCQAQGAAYQNSCVYVEPHVVQLEHLDAEGNPTPETADACIVFSRAYADLLEYLHNLANGRRLVTKLGKDLHKVSTMLSLIERKISKAEAIAARFPTCLLYTSPSPRDS